MKASELKKIADDSADTVQKNLYRVLENEMKSLAGKNIYTVIKKYEPHQIEFITSMLKKDEIKYEVQGESLVINWGN